MGHLLYRRAEPRLVQLHGQKKAQSKQFDFISRVASTIHSAWAFYMTCREWQETDVLDQWMQTFSPTYQRVLAFSCVYFCADFIACVLVTSERGVQRVGVATLAALSTLCRTYHGNIDPGVAAESVVAQQFVEDGHLVLPHLALTAPFKLRTTGDQYIGDVVR